MIENAAEKTRTTVPRSYRELTVMMRIIETLLLRGKLGPFGRAESGSQNVFSQLGCKRSFIQYTPDLAASNLPPSPISCDWDALSTTSSGDVLIPVIRDATIQADLLPSRRVER
jgi:hypothetical protein